MDRLNEADDTSIAAGSVNDYTDTDKTKDSSNKDLLLALQYVEKDFNYTKETLLKMSDHLDKLEYTYNLLHKEYTNRT